MKQFSKIQFNFDANPSKVNLSVIPKAKAHSEFFISNLFAQYLLLRKISVEKLELNPDDRDKGADVFITIDKKQKGIQLTRLTINNLLWKQSKSALIESDIVDELMQRVNIDFKLNIHIFPSVIKDNVRLNKKKLQERLIEELVVLIEKNELKLKEEKAYFPIEINNPNLKTVINSIALEFIPENMHSKFTGENNIFVNLNFDDITFTEKDIETTVDKIYDNKNKGKSEILIIWADRREILNTDEMLIDKLKIKFKNTSFEKVFLFLLHDSAELFFKLSKFYNIK